MLLKEKERKKPSYWLRVRFLGNSSILTKKTVIFFLIVIKSRILKWNKNTFLEIK